MTNQIISVLWDPACAHSNWHKEIVSGVKSAAAGKYHVELFSELNDEVLKNLTDPVILIGFSHDTLMNTLKVLRDHAMRIILVGMDSTSLSAYDISCVTPSRSRHTGQLLEYLHQCGRHRLAMVGVGAQSLNDLVKVNAALHYSSGKALREEDVFKWSDDLNEAIRLFLPRVKDYDGVICTNDYFAVALTKVLIDQGIRIPEDLFLVSFSDCLISRWSNPGITSLALDYPSQGRYAFFVWRAMRDLSGEKTTFRVVAPAKLVVRESTAFMPVKETPMEELMFNAQDERDLFYNDPTIKKLMRIEFCLGRRDELGLKIIRCLQAGMSYESICDECFISMNALHYRLNKLFQDAECANKSEFLELFSEFSTPETKRPRTAAGNMRE